MPQLLRAGGESRPDTLRVCLVWHPSSSGRDNISWNAKLPHGTLMIFEVLGTRSSRKGRFRADCITPCGKLPPMTNRSRRGLVKSLRSRLEAQLGASVEVITINIIDWGYDE